MPDILYRSAFTLARDIKAQRLSASEVLEFFLDRVERFNPGLNAVVAFDLERARKRAKAADAAAASGDDWGPLHGVPLTIKDAFCTEGLVTVGGIPECRENIPRANALAVQKYVDAGAIIFGKTNVPLMSADLQSYNEVYGTTNNPWNTDHTCGGSSGGAGAAVAAGLTPLELGSDIGGSIRTPSHFNGVFGHKPSYGIVSQRGHLPPGEGTLSEADLSVVGPIGTSVDDLEQALDLLVGLNPEEAVAYRIELPPAPKASLANMRIAVWADDDFCPVDSEIREAILRTGEALAAAGASVDFEARPAINLEDNLSNYGFMLSAAIGGGMPDAVFEAMKELSAASDPADESFVMQQARGIAAHQRDWVRQMEKRQHLKAAWAAFFKDYDAVLCPCAFVTAFPHNQEGSQFERTLTVNGEQRPYLDILGWAGLTLNAELPATAVPVALSSEGLPIGVQVVADYLQDKTALAVARQITAVLDFVPHPPGYEA
ncbi:MAG: amidase [Pseudomonadota bacterium]